MTKEKQNEAQQKKKQKQKQRQTQQTELNGTGSLLAFCKSQMEIKNQINT